MNIPAMRRRPLLIPVDIDLDERAPVHDLEPLDIGWRMSSYELHCGLRVSEQPFDTLPGELQEALIESSAHKRRSWLDDEELASHFAGRM